MTCVLWGSQMKLQRAKSRQSDPNIMLIAAHETAS